MEALVAAARKAPWPCAAEVDGAIYLNESPLRHAEMVALENLEGVGHTMRVTAEPCPMCMAAIVWSGKVERVEYGTSIPRLIELGHWQSSIRAADVINSFAPRRTIELVQVGPELTDALYRR
ncbi:hypothetical protein KUW19_00880 [Ferrimonas balearica]|uniref:hypothetical protein n=1 Tax=Ferrimonas balearica TaxID=44012 RepID=UPI001C945F75|nr:hypothetical protein [Ferrimonas balearica]MBY6105031.1 hypothetical protein [Ferrimonas balearica]